MQFVHPTIFLSNVLTMLTVDLERSNYLEILTKKNFLQTNSKFLFVIKTIRKPAFKNHYLTVLNQKRQSESPNMPVMSFWIIIIQIETRRKY